MSKKLSYKGIIAAGLEQKIKLATKEGKTGYQIVKFQIMDEAPGTGNEEWVAKVVKKSGSIASTVDFSDGDMLAVAYSTTAAATGTPSSPQYIIFDNEIFNQDVYVQIADADGGTGSCNFYLELKTVKLSDVESTQLTLKNLRTIASR
tara:strand:+ start:372 stop:815 length:444 start_codon:yes stop_codon:yes gene_type:complete